METAIQHLQNRIVDVTVEVRANPHLWPVLEALRATLVRVIAARVH